MDQNNQEEECSICLEHMENLIPKNEVIGQDTILN